MKLIVASKKPAKQAANLDGKKTKRDVSAASRPESIDPQKAAIGARIAAARRKKRLSQEELALQLGVTTAAIWQWERGYTMPKMSNLDELANLLDTDRGYLWTGNIEDELRKAQDVLEMKMLELNRRMNLFQRMDLIRSMSEMLGDEKGPDDA